ncbi:MAG: hypothetical protein CMA72_07140 [Euryarchaeota archaeon]|nr:hypothetical protein [Euryarchaeota archaeon]|tara:strand:+ start:46730 stop:47254 length:525 start_codon:yes stop_codon:yes gene_type:complete
MKKDIFTNLQAQDVPIPDSLLDSLEGMVTESRLRQYIKEAIGSRYGRTRKKKQVVPVPRLKIIVDIPGIDIQSTQHSRERQDRHRTPDGKGYGISGKSILDVINAGLGFVIDDFANGELANGEKFLIVGKTGSGPPLNIVAVLNMKPGDDELRVVTVMRKKNFGSDLTRYEVTV